jgi:hypothetical protein
VSRDNGRKHKTYMYGPSFWGETLVQLEGQYAKKEEETAKCSGVRVKFILRLPV